MSKPVEDSTRPLPLAGVRVLDLTHVLAGPLTTMLLGDLGAEIIKVERPQGGDETRTIPPMRSGVSHYFLSVNRNKKSICVDLKTDAGRELVMRLAESADVVVENFRPGVAKKLGLDADSVRGRKPELIYCSISAFGQDGDWATRSAFDIAVQAMSGAMMTSGHHAARPARASIPLADVAAGLFATISILGCLAGRRDGDAGRTVDVSMFDTSLSLLGYLASSYLMTGENPPRVGDGHASIVPYGVYEAADGYLVIATLTESFWPKLCLALERGDLAADPRFATNVERLGHREAINTAIAETVKLRSVEEWCARMTAADVPHAPVLTVAEAVEHEVAHARGLVRTVDHPTLGPTRLLGPAVTLADSPSPLRPPPLLGADTPHVLEEVLGLTPREIAALLDAGVVADASADQSWDTSIRIAEERERIEEERTGP